MHTPHQHSSLPQPSLADLYVTLRERLPRLTKGKKLVVERLHAEGKPLTAHEIFSAAAASSDANDVDLATIYRNLDALERANVIEKIEFSAGGWKYALAGAHHTHSIECTRCGQQVVMGECVMADVEKIIAERTGYTGIHHTVNFTGCCPSCQTSVPRAANEI
jgi:Fe2+ or Zn2+ uptake regulation protein